MTFYAIITIDHQTSTIIIHNSSQNQQKCYP